MVEQVDREAAADYCVRMTGDIVGKALKIRRGECDEYTEVQAFTRHRQSAEQRMIDIAQACLDQGYPLAVALEMMKGENDG